MLWSVGERQVKARFGMVGRQGLARLGEVSSGMVGRHGEFCKG